MTISNEKGSQISNKSDVVINNCNNNNNNNNSNNYSCPLENGERNNPINGTVTKVSLKVICFLRFLGKLHEHVKMF